MFVARVRLLPAQKSGRKTPVASRFRCQCFIGTVDGNGRASDNDAMFEFLDSDGLSPGDEARANVTPLAPDSWGHIGPGFGIVMREGPRQIGVATVEAILD